MRINFRKNPVLSRGYSLLEVLVAIAIIAVAATLAMRSYQAYMDRIDIHQATSDIKVMSGAITAYALDTGSYPDSLADVNLDGYLDPWGNAYSYTNLSTAKGNGKARKDKNLVPLNTDFDLFSKGKDGASVGPLTAKASKDDIIRANNGQFIGLAEDY